MLQSSIQRLKDLCEIIPVRLDSISDADFVYKSSPEKWSKKEIIGHLTDSAANNHQRFIRSRFENIPFIRYDQNEWAEKGRHQEADRHLLTAFWKTYNLFLCELAAHIPKDELNALCNTGDTEPHTVEWLFTDYVKHQEHHLKQIFSDLN